MPLDVLLGDDDELEPEGDDELDELLEGGVELELESDGEVLLLDVDDDEGGVMVLDDAEVGGVVVLVLVLVRSQAATVNATSNTDAASMACLMISPWM
jgi:hypothetical protein